LALGPQTYPDACATPRRAHTHQEPEHMLHALARCRARAPSSNELPLLRAAVGVEVHTHVPTARTLSLCTTHNHLYRAETACERVDALERLQNVSRGALSAKLPKHVHAHGTAEPRAPAMLNRLAARCTLRAQERQRHGWRWRCGTVVAASRVCRDETQPPLISTDKVDRIDRWPSN